jgi:hypothetical protein
MINEMNLLALKGELSRKRCISYKGKVSGGGTTEDRGNKNSVPSAAVLLLPRKG